MKRSDDTKMCNCAECGKECLAASEKRDADDQGASLLQSLFDRSQTQYTCPNIT